MNKLVLFSRDRGEWRVVFAGDLMCKSRAGSGATYDNIEPGMATHCDVVTSSGPGQLITIGGNVANSVSTTSVPVNSSGFIQAPGYFAVIKVG